MMAATEWFRRGHAARIRAAAHDAGFEVDVVVGFRIDVTTPTTQITRSGPVQVSANVLRAEFNAKTGQIKPTTVRSRYPGPQFTSYAHHTGATPADVARDVIGWLAAGAPDKWPHLPTTLQMQVAAAQQERPNIRSVDPVSEDPGGNVIPFRRNR